MSIGKMMIFILAVFSWSGAATSTKCDDDEDCDVVVTESFKVGDSTICFNKNATYNGYCIIPYKNDKREGLMKRYYESGALHLEAPFKNDKRDGLSKQYYESGAIHLEVPLKNDKGEGLSKEYYESGSLKQEATYKDRKASCRERV